MALQFITVNAAGAITSRGVDGADDLLTAIGDDLDTTVDLALAQTDIDASVGAETAVEAIRTAVDAAILDATTARTAQGGTVTLVIDDASITTLNQLKAALDSLYRAALGSNLLS